MAIQLIKARLTADGELCVCVCLTKYDIALI